MATSRLSLAGILVVALLLGGCKTIVDVSTDNRVNCFRNGGAYFSEGLNNMRDACLYKNPAVN